MKRIAFILPVLMLFLTAQPLLTRCQVPIIMHTGVKGAKCCSEKKTEKKKECNVSDQCDPFASCCRLHYVVVFGFFCKIPVVQIDKTSPDATCYRIESGYRGDSWHPPEYIIMRTTYS